jgi:heme/copper-type cytochrome/quinol oxidase subunit 1
MYGVSLVMMLATPVLAMTLALIAAERLFGVGIFDPALGGDPLLFQHFFWFYSHPAVYIMVLPSMGVVSELITASVRRRIFGYRFMVYSIIGIAVVGFLVWGHHMFVAGQSMYASVVFSILSFIIAVPSAIKVFNWTATLYKGDIAFGAPMIYALGFVGLFMVGGLTGLFLAATALDVNLTDTYFVVGRRRRHGVPGGYPFLVAKDNGAALLGSVGTICRHPHVPRLQPHVLPAVHRGRGRHAAAVPRISRPIRPPQRPFIGGRGSSRGRLPASHRLFPLVVPLR